MPIKTQIDASADPAPIKASLELLQKYETALKRLYGVRKAPYLRAATAAGKDALQFAEQQEAAARAAAATQARFSAATQKAGKSFAHLAVNVRSSIENLSRYALAPLQILFPAGLTVGLFGIGAGLLGAGAVGLGGFALDRVAADVSSRRRQALGLGISYGSLSSYELNFARFGLGDQTLSNVAGGVYDITSPQYLPLLTSGAATGDTASAAIALIKNLPGMLQGIPDQMVGPVARSRGWTNVLPMDTIIRLKNANPQEVQRQIARYEADKKTLDISVEAQRKWADFDTALSRAGRRIETVLAGELAPLAEPLTHLSESAVHLIDALVNSGTLTKGLGAIEAGLEDVEAAIGSDRFKRDGKRLLEGLKTAGPYIANFVDYAAKVLLFTGRGLYYGARLAGDPNYNPSAIDLAGDLSGQRRPDREVPPTPHINYDRNPSGRPSIRYGTRGTGGPTVDSMTGKIIHEFHGMPYPNRNNSTDSVAGIPANSITPLPHETPTELYDRVRATYPHLTSKQCVALVRAVAGIKENVWDWRRGVNVNSANLPPGTPVATFLDRQGHPTDFYDAHQGVGAPGNNTTHAAVFVGYTKDGILVDEQYVGSGGPRLHEYKFGDPRGGEKDAENYFVVNDLSGLPAGTNDPFRREVQAQIAANRFAKRAQAASSAPFRANAPERNYFDHLPAATGIDPLISAGPLAIYDHSGGSISIEATNMHTAQ